MYNDRTDEKKTADTDTLAAQQSSAQPAPTNEQIIQLSPILSQFEFLKTTTKFNTASEEEARNKMLTYVKQQIDKGCISQPDDIDLIQRLWNNPVSRKGLLHHIELRQDFPFIQRIIVSDTIYSLDFDGALSHSRALHEVGQFIVEQLHDIPMELRAKIDKSIQPDPQDPDNKFTHKKILGILWKDRVEKLEKQMAPEDQAISRLYQGDLLAKIVEIFRGQNKSLLNEIGAANGSAVVSGSNRQDVAMEKENAKKHGFSAPIFQGLFPEQIIPLLMGETLATRAQDLTTFNNLLAYAVTGKPSTVTSATLDVSNDPIDDEHKLALIYFQAHAFAALQAFDSNKKFKLIFVDDRLDICLKLEQVYSKNPHLLPKNCTLQIQRYAPSVGITEPVIFATIEGTGEIQAYTTEAELRNIAKTYSKGKEDPIYRLSDHNLDSNPAHLETIIASVRNSDAIWLAPESLTTHFGFRDKVNEVFTSMKKILIPEYLANPSNERLAEANSYWNTIITKVVPSLNEIFLNAPKNRISGSGFFKFMDFFSTHMCTALKTEEQMKNFADRLNDIKTSPIWQSKILEQAGSGQNPLLQAMINHCKGEPSFNTENGSPLLSLNTAEGTYREILAKTPPDKKEAITNLWNTELEAASQSDMQTSAGVQPLHDMKTTWEARKALLEQAKEEGKNFKVSMESLKQVSPNNLIIQENRYRVQYNKIKTAIIGLSVSLGTAGIVAGVLLTGALVAATGGIAALVLACIAIALIVAPIIFGAADYIEQKKQGFDYFSTRSLQTPPTANAGNAQTSPITVQEEPMPAASQTVPGTLGSESDTARTATVMQPKVEAQANQENYSTPQSAG